MPFSSQTLANSVLQEVTNWPGSMYTRKLICYPMIIPEEMLKYCYFDVAIFVNWRLIAQGFTGRFFDSMHCVEHQDFRVNKRFPLISGIQENTGFQGHATGFYRKDGPGVQWRHIYPKASGEREGFLEKWSWAFSRDTPTVVIQVQLSERTSFLTG